MFYQYHFKSWERVERRLEKPRSFNNTSVRLVMTVQAIIIRDIKTRVINSGILGLWGNLEAGVHHNLLRTHNNVLIGHSIYTFAKHDGQFA